MKKLSVVFFFMASMIDAMDPTSPGLRRDTNHAISPRLSLGVARALEERRRMDSKQGEDAPSQEEKSPEFKNPWYAQKWAMGCYEQKLREEIEQHDLEMMLTCPRIMKFGGASKLLEAIKKFDETTVEKLLAAGCNPDGRKQLHEAVEHSSVKIARLLLEFGADPNAAGLFGRTPLHIACMCFIPSMVELLLEYGADPDLKTELGKIPADYAQERGVSALQHFLRCKEKSKQAAFDGPAHRQAKKKEREAVIKKLKEAWKKTASGGSGGGRASMVLH